MNLIQSSSVGFSISFANDNFIPNFLSFETTCIIWIELRPFSIKLSFPEGLNPSKSACNTSLRSCIACCLI